MSVKTEKRKAWEAFSSFIRLRDALKTTGTKTHLNCITCKKRVKAFGRGGAHAGHFISGRGNSILIDEKFVHGQCSGCNTYKGGDWVRYEREMIKMHGEEAVEEVKRRSLQVKKIKAHEWKEIAKEYREKYKELDENN